MAPVKTTNVQIVLNRDEENKFRNEEIFRQMTPVKTTNVHREIIL
jgi:hypothetical protein